MSRLTKFLRRHGLTSRHAKRALLRPFSVGANINEPLSQDAFVSSMRPSGKILEIGPFTLPKLRGENVKYFDVLDRDNLVRRARRLSYPCENPVNIDYVSPTGDLSIITEKFDYIFSSHCIEHQPNLVGHLQRIEKLLNRNGGRYLVVVPDKRYCFDHFQPTSSIEEILDAHAKNRRLHTNENVFKTITRATHNDPSRHWQGDHGRPGDKHGDGLAEKLQLIADYDESGEKYVDTHAWRFTPESFFRSLKKLRDAGMTQIKVENIYDTPRNTFEFCASLILH